MSAPRPAAVVFCERLDNESFCQSIVDALSAHLDVRPCGPGWPVERLADVDPTGASFYLELDAASGNFVRPERLERLELPKFAWLIDTHKKPEFHRQIARDVDITFFAMKSWGHVLDRPCAWLPLHADPRYFHAVDQERRWDLVFVGSQTWRAAPIERLARKHGLSVHVTTTTGPREKSETAAAYAQARLVFNRHVTNDLNFRVFEATACGRVLLTDAQPNGQYDLFEDGRHLVLYKDDDDLERQALRLLADDDARQRIEGEAAAHAQTHHTTPARVAQLVRAVESHLGRSLGGAPAPRIVVPVQTPTTAGAAPPRPIPPSVAETPRRWLVLTGDEAPTVDLRGYAERLAAALARGGHDVTVVRAQRASLPGRVELDGRLRTLDVPPGPLPRPSVAENSLLAGAGPLHARIDRVMREHGPFDAILADGPLGQLTGPPLSRRHGVPLLLALGSCEVLRRRNRLTRDQLYLAELEHWATERADHVLVPWPEVDAAVRRHYGVERVTRLGAPGPGWRPSGADAARLLERLGVDERPVLALGFDAADGLGENTLFVEPDGRFVATGPDGRRTLSRRRPSGPSLGALLHAARAVVVTPCDPARSDAAHLAWRLAVNEPDGLVRALIDAAPPRATDEGAVVAALTHLLPVRAGAGRVEEAAHGLL